MSFVPITTEKMIGRAYTMPGVSEYPRHKMNQFTWKLYMLPFVYFLCFLASLAGASGK